MNQSKANAGRATAVIRPSFRLVRPLYTLTFILVAVVFGLSNNWPDNHYEWLFIIPALLLLWTVSRHVKQHFTVMTIGGGKLRCETGVLSKTTRTMDLNRIQDVTVTQSLIQRMLNIGNIRIETAGEQGGLEMQNIDRPQVVSEFILETAGK